MDETGLRQLVGTLDKHALPCVLIGARALALYGCRSTDPGIELAVRALDCDALLEFFYAQGWRLPVRVDPATETVDWAADAATAGQVVTTDGRGGLDFYRPDDPGAHVLCRMDVPIPFARLRQRAIELGDDGLRVASLDDMIILLEHQARHGYGSPHDTTGLEFLLEKKKNRNSGII